MHELLSRPSVTVEKRTASRPGLRAVRFECRPDGVTEWDGDTMHYPERQQAIECNEQGNVPKTWQPVVTS